AMASSAALRSAIGLALQAGNAAFAAATALSSCAFEPRGHFASTSSVAGFSTSMVASPSSSLPLISTLYRLIVRAGVFRPLARGYRVWNAGDSGGPSVMMIKFAPLALAAALVRAAPAFAQTTTSAATGPPTMRPAVSGPPIIDATALIGP